VTFWSVVDADFGDPNEVMKLAIPKRMVFHGEIWHGNRRCPYDTAKEWVKGSIKARIRYA